MEENKKVSKLPIPANVTDRQEIFPGFGVDELKVVGIGAGVGVILAMVVALVTKELIAPLFAFIVPCYIAYMLSFRDKYGENLLEKFKYLLEFRKQQKLYYYEYVPLVKMVEEEEQNE